MCWENLSILQPNTLREKLSRAKRYLYNRNTDGKYDVLLKNADQPYVLVGHSVEGGNFARCRTRGN